MILPLKWSEVRTPCEDCAFDHVVSETPFGRFLIAWDGEDGNDWVSIRETPWGEWGGATSDLNFAKSLAWGLWIGKLMACASENTK